MTTSIRSESRTNYEINKRTKIAQIFNCHNKEKESEKNMTIHLKHDRQTNRQKNIE